MAVTEAGVGIGIGYPQGGAKLQVLGDVRIDGDISANHPVLAPWVQLTTHTDRASSVQQPHQQYALIVERTNHNTDNRIAGVIRLYGTVSAILTWRVSANELCNYAQRLLRRRALCFRTYSGWSGGALDGEVGCY